MIQPRTWDHEFKSGKLKKRLYKGIPDAVRGEVWSRLLHIQKTKAEQKNKYEVYAAFYSHEQFNSFLYSKGNAQACPSVVT